MLKPARILVLTLVAGVIAVSTATAHATTPTFVTSTVDDTVFFPETSAICGFPVFGRDTGTVTTMVTTLPDGSVRYHDVVVKITTTFFSTDPDHTGTATTHPSGPFIETDHPDGSVTMNSIGQTGHVTIPGQGLAWAEIGITKVEIDANGDVTELAHGIFSPDHSGICPLL
jgi:hypothetical protein